MRHRKKDSARNGFSNLPKAIKDFLFVKRKQIRGTPKRKKRIEGKPIEKRGIYISEIWWEVFLSQNSLSYQRNAGRQIKIKKEKDVLARWINKQLNSKSKADKKRRKNQKRNLIPKPEKLTAKERGIVQWITRFESGYRRKRIGTRFFGVWE